MCFLWTSTPSGIISELFLDNTWSTVQSSSLWPPHFWIEPPF